MSNELLHRCPKCGEWPGFMCQRYTVAGWVKRPIPHRERSPQLFHEFHGYRKDSFCSCLVAPIERKIHVGLHFAKVGNNENKS